MINVLHLTAHLGGGVGRALAALVRCTVKAGFPVHHDFVCFEELEKSSFADEIRREGSTVSVGLSPEQLAERIQMADVVQLEFWNHPATIGALCKLSPLTRARLVVWCHVSGLHTPVIPSGLAELAHRFVFTSTCSLEAPVSPGALLSVISSSGGFEHVPYVQRVGNLSLGYVGSLQFSKLHPSYVDLVKGIELPISMVGDPVTRTSLEAQARKAGRIGLFDFRGYRSDVAAELGAIDVMLYLLNPEHYGTTENALLEAMASGCVPIVLDNPAERTIVRHAETGFVVRDAVEVAAVVKILSVDRARFACMSEAAAHDVRMRFSPEVTARQLTEVYRQVVQLEPRPLSFERIFGRTPHEWFRSCQDPKIFGLDGTVRIPESLNERVTLFEKTKGSAFHFHDVYPDDALLSQWVDGLLGVSW